MEHAGGAKNPDESIKAFSETDVTDDLEKFDVPTLVLHDAPHVLTATHRDQVNAQLLKFIQG